MLDLYCERIAPGLWGEPLNTLSNLAFFWAAWACWRLVNDRESARALRLLVLLIVWIAIGSTLFHMFAKRWAQILDVTPIFLFQAFWVWLYSRTVRPERAGLLHMFARILSANYQRPRPMS